MIIAVILNCSFLVLFISDCSLAGLLRLLVASELYLCTSAYIDHPALQEAQASSAMFTNHEDTIFSMILTDEVTDEFDRTRCKHSAVQYEASLSCENLRWSSMIHLFALTNVIVIPIFSVYHIVNEGFRRLFHKVIEPLNMSPASEKSGTFGIMWTRDDDLDSTHGICFEPNHFCLMIR